MEDATSIVGPFMDRQDHLYAGIFDGHGSQDVARVAAQVAHVLLQHYMDSGRSQTASSQSA